MPAPLYKRIGAAALIVFASTFVTSCGSDESSPGSISNKPESSTQGEASQKSTPKQDAGAAGTDNSNGGEKSGSQSDGSSSGASGANDIHAEENAIVKSATVPVMAMKKVAQVCVTGSNTKPCVDAKRASFIESDYVDVIATGFASGFEFRDNSLTPNIVDGQERATLRLYVPGKQNTVGTIAQLVKIGDKWKVYDARTTPDGSEYLNEHPDIMDDWDH